MYVLFKAFVFCYRTFCNFRESIFCFTLRYLPSHSLTHSFTKLFDNKNCVIS